MTILSQVSRQRTYGWILKQIYEFNFPLERGCQVFLHLDHQQRVPADIEKVVVHANLLHLQHCAPHAREIVRSSSVTGALRKLCARPASFSGNGSARRSILPLGERGIAGKNTKAAGTMCSGRLFGDGPATRPAVGGFSARPTT